MMRYAAAYKIILGGMASILVGCQAPLFDVKGVYSSPDRLQDFPADQLYEQGKSAFKNNDMIQALKFFKAANGKDPHSVKTLNGLGSVYDHLRRFDLAQNYYYRALHLDPLSRSTLNNLGYSHLLQNKPVLAVEYFRKAYRIDSDSTYVQHNLKIAEQKLEKKNARIRLTKNLSEMDKQADEKRRQYSVVKITSKIQQLKTHSSADYDVSLSAIKRPVGYQLMLTGQKEAYYDHMTGAQKAGQKPEVSLKPIIFTTRADIVYVSRPAGKKPIVRAMPLVEISNGAGRRGMAARMKKYMKARGISVRRLTNADHFSHMTSRIFYHLGWEEYSRALASQLPISVFIEEADGQAADVRLEIGGDLLAYDAELIKQYRGKK